MVAWLAKRMKSGAQSMAADMEATRGKDNPQTL
jgi:hypothetical protein